MLLRLKTPATFGIVTVILLLSGAAEAHRLWHIALVVAGSADASELEQGIVDSPLLVYIPGRTPWWSIWTVLTSACVERNLFSFITTLGVVLVGGSYCENRWESKLYLGFVIGVSAVCAVIRFMIAQAVYLTTGRTREVYGIAPLAMGILVAMKQLVSDHTILLFQGRIRVRVKWLPVCMLLGTSLLALMGHHDPLVAGFIGFVVSWVYLRFYQPNSERAGASVISRSTTGHRTRGDASNAFAFDQFFPPGVAPWVEKLCSPISRLARTTRLIPTFSSEEIEAANFRHANRLSGNVLPFYRQGARSTNERRKQMLQALS